MIGILMGSKSDWDTMSGACETLEQLDIPCEVRVLSAHRAPELVAEYAETAENRGLEALIAGAGGAAHLAGAVAAKTVLPVIGVPIQTESLGGMDSLLSIVQMPKGIPVGTMAIGRSGAINAALFAAAILARKDERIRRALGEYRRNLTLKAAAEQDPRESS